MGRLWWQREARAKEEQARADAKAARRLNVSDDVLAVVAVSDETTDTAVSIDESVAILTQIVEDININSESVVQQDDNVVEEDPADQAADVAVPGITITQSENTSFNSKKRRPR
jgi:hypothetical protein